MPYGRQVSIAFGPPITPMVKRLVILTSAAFLLTFLPAQMFGWYLPYALFSLRPYEVVHHFFIWQLVTYLFLHGWPGMPVWSSFFHIIFNLFALWMFGSDLERLWGSRRFLFYYFLTGIGAGLSDVLLSTLFPPDFPQATIGCSGAVYGLLLAYGLLFPDRPILFALLIPIKAKWFVALMGLIEFVSSLSAPGSGVSHVAHLGGMLFGFLYLRGSDLPYRWQLRYHDWRRSRLRRRFEVYMRKQEKKDDAGRWIN
jgi:membrane associated rhomboid family serine protease